MKRSFNWLVLSFVVLVSLLPIVWQLVTSLRPEAVLSSLPPLFPRSPSFEHYRTVWIDTDIIKTVGNSLLVASLCTFFSIIIGASAAFALSMLNVRFASLILGLMLSASMFPVIASISPLYVLVRGLYLRDSLAALVLLHTSFSLPLSVWILTSFFRTLPMELYRSARTDGCSELQTLLKVILPIASPGIASAGILVFIFSWNEFLLALTFTVTKASRTAPVELALFPGVHHIPWGEIAAASILVVIPSVLLVFLFQRRIIDGITAGAVKG